MLRWARITQKQDALCQRAVRQPTDEGQVYVHPYEVRRVSEQPSRQRCCWLPVRIGRAIRPIGASCAVRTETTPRGCGLLRHYPAGRPPCMPRLWLSRRATAIRARVVSLSTDHCRVLHAVCLRLGTRIKSMRNNRQPGARQVGQDRCLVNLASVRTDCLRSCGRACACNTRNGEVVGTTG